MNTVVERIEPPVQVPAEAAGNLIQVIERAARDPSIDIDKMERLLQMQERILERNARASYAAALARMQPELPMIAERGGIKDRSGNVQSKYALWEDVVTVITPILARHGFSLSFRTSNDGSGVTVTGVLAHADGHAEQTSLMLPIDTSGSKNAVQSVGSSTSYGKRYTACALLNLRTGGEDDDGRAGAPVAKERPDPPEGYEKWKADILAIDEYGELGQAYGKSGQRFRQYVNDHDARWFDDHKAALRAKRDAARKQRP